MIIRKGVANDLQLAEVVDFQPQLTVVKISS